MQLGLRAGRQAAIQLPEVQGAILLNERLRQAHRSREIQHVMSDIGLC